MPFELYKILHITGFVMIFLALGGQLFYVLNGGTKQEASGRGLLGAFHGTGWLLVLVSGFAMHAKLHLGWDQGWIWAKVVILLLLGGLIAVPWRKPELAKPLFLSAPLWIVLAAWLALMKPF